LHGLVEVA